MCSMVSTVLFTGSTTHPTALFCFVIVWQGCVTTTFSHAAAAVLLSAAQEWSAALSAGPTSPSDASTDARAVSLLRLAHLSQAEGGTIPSQVTDVCISHVHLRPDHMYAHAFTLCKQLHNFARHLHVVKCVSSHLPSSRSSTLWAPLLTCCWTMGHIRCAGWTALTH
jgi:hypothetical protein